MQLIYRMVYIAILMNAADKIYRKITYSPNSDGNSNHRLPEPVESYGKLHAKFSMESIDPVDKDVFTKMVTEGVTALQHEIRAEIDKSIIATIVKNAKSLSDNTKFH